MGDALKKRLLQPRFDGPMHEALLNLLVTAGHVRERVERLCAAHGISARQYNVLRILRGVHPEGYARCDVARRLIERSPDVTRLIDRLEREGVVERARSNRDARLSITRITPKGLRLLERMGDPMDSLHRELGERLTAREARELSRLCERLYESQG